MGELIWMLAVSLQLGLSLGQSRNEDGSAEKKKGTIFIFNCTNLIFYKTLTSKPSNLTANILIESYLTTGLE